MWKSKKVKYERKEPPTPAIDDKAERVANGSAMDLSKSGPKESGNAVPRLASLDADTDILRSQSRARDHEDLLSSLPSVVPLAAMPSNLHRYAYELEQDIQDYITSNNIEMQEKCVIAQDILRYGLEKSPELIDELYLQLLRHLKGSNTTTSVRGWELMLLVAYASRPSSKYLELVSNFVHAAAHATSQWPTTTSILAKRTWSTLKHNTKPGRRVNVPLAGEIASVLNSKTLKVQVSFVDGSNKWLAYDWTTTVSSAVEQLAAQIGLKNYQDYTLFETRRIPKKMDKDGTYSTATLPPDSYLLLEDHRRIADVVHDYAARGAENKLLLKRRRFDSAGADFSKPQFIALTEAHQAAMDEKIAEVANLTLRLREMSGKVMWFENLQNEKSAELDTVQAELETLQQRNTKLELSGGSSDTAALVRERDELLQQIKQLKEAQVTPLPGTLPKDLQSEGDNRGVAIGLDLSAELAEKTATIAKLQAELEAVLPLVKASDLEAAANTVGSEKGALQGLGDLKTDLEKNGRGQKDAVLAEKDRHIEELTVLVDKLTCQLNLFENEEGEASRELHESFLQDFLTSHENRKDVNGSQNFFEGQLTSMQEALDLQAAAKEELEAELDVLRTQLQEKEGGFKSQEREWRGVLSVAKAEAASIQSRLKSKDAALAQATADLDRLHSETGQLRVALETKDDEVKALNNRMRILEATSSANGALLGSQSKAAGRHSLEVKDLDVLALQRKLAAVSQERDTAVDKLSGIQTLMSGLGLPPVQNEDRSASKRASKASRSQRAGNEDSAFKPSQNGGHTPPSETDSSRSRRSLERRLNKVISDPLETGQDPRRESIGGLAAPTHLRGAAPLRVLPEEKRQFGTRHPLFAPNYVQHSPLAAGTPDISDKRHYRALKKEAAAMLEMADEKRRLFIKKDKEVGEYDRPAPNTATTPRATDRINKGTHLLGLLSNSAITNSQDSLVSGSGASEPKPTPEKENVNVNARRLAQAARAERAAALTRGASGYDSRILKSHASMTSTQSESDLQKAYENALMHA